MMDLRYQSWKSWKIVNIDLTQQFILSIFTDSSYQLVFNHLIATDFIDWLALEYQQEEKNKRYLKNSKTYFKI